MNGSELAKLAGLGAGVGFGEDVEQGDYHIVGSGVILHAGPDASSDVLGTLQNGDGIYAFGDVMLDDEHMVGSDGSAQVNDGSSPGIEYVHVGTQTHGAGWVAINFISPGKNVVPTPQPQPAPMPSSPTTKDKVTTVLIGGLIGVAVLGGIVLLVKHAKSPRQLAHA